MRDTLLWAAFCACWVIAGFNLGFGVAQARWLNIVAGLVCLAVNYWTGTLWLRRLSR